MSLRLFPTVIFCAAICSSVFASATNLMESIIAQHREMRFGQLSTGRGNPHQPKPKCTNFTGSWKGKCVITDSTGTKELPYSDIIRQSGCKILFSGSGAETIGATYNQNEGRDDMTSVSSRNLDWNNDRSEIKIVLSSNYRVFKDYVGTAQGGGTMKLENGKLILNYKVDEKFWESKETVDFPWTMDCTCEKE